MGQIDSLQIKAEEDNCLYVLNLSTRKWHKVCEDLPLKDIPKSVWDKVEVMRVIARKR